MFLLIDSYRKWITRWFEAFRITKSQNSSNTEAWRLNIMMLIFGDDSDGIWYEFGIDAFIHSTFEIVIRLAPTGAL